MFVNLTIIIPVYNSQKYLFECLNSVCKQIKRDVEVIIVDDFSYDDSIKISDNMTSADIEDWDSRQPYPIPQIKYQESNYK